MKNKITDFVKQNNLISKNETILIAFSGGADSVFLAEYLLSIKEKLNLTLKMSHIEHGIRGKESLKDYEFSKSYASKHNIEFFECHIDAVNESKKAKMGVEEYSRKRRYEFFDTIKCDKIATAHNLTDNVETMLFRIARGTSIHGLCSIPVKRDKIIRPLLSVSGEEIRNYLNENNIEYCVDSTNTDNDYSRNYIRNVIIPEFKNINSGFIHNAAKLINNINETEKIISDYTDKIYNTVLTDNKLLIAKLKEQSDGVIKRIIIKYFKDNDIELDTWHLSDILKLLDKRGKIQIKDNIFAFSDTGFLRCGKFTDTDFDKISIDKRIISVNSEKDFLNNCELLNKKFDFYCDCDKIIGNVYVRKRKEGDYIAPSNRNCTKSLKKLFNEYHIAVEKRNSIPIICDDSGIIGVYGYCADERVKFDFNTKNILTIVIHMDTEDKI